MASAMNGNNRYRTNQLIKVEKENENLELKNRMKNVSKEKAMRRETVWDRLSKVRRTPSSENIAYNRSRQNLSTKPSHRFQIMKQMAAHHQQQQQQILYQQKRQQQEEDLQQSPRRPLTPNSGSNRRTGTQKYHMQKAIIMPEIDNQGFLYVCKPLKSVREILTARSLNQSKSSFEDHKNSDGHQACEEVPQSHSPSMTVIATDNTSDESTDDSSDEFKLAPLMSSRSGYDLINNSSARIVHNFHEVLRRRGQSFLQPEELELVKKVIKNDKRYHHLDKSDPKLFKEILKAQLQDILKHEYAVKQALQKLESSDSLPACREVQTIQPINEIVTYSQHSGEKQKLEVDVVFKNVPSLEKEIIILRALGEKLDATLKRSSSQRSLRLKSQETTVVAKSAPKDKIFMLIEIKPRSFIYAIECHANSSVRSTGLRLTSAVAQEFRIAQKTIVELKEDANRSFYIPINPETAELKRTSFKKLKQNPDILMRHLKAKNTMVPFNVLDQDPIFFNNILFSKNRKDTNLPSDISTEAEQSKKEPPKKEQPTLCEGGDSCQFYDVKLEHGKHHSKQIIAKSEVKIKKSSKLMEPCVRGAKDRRRIRRYSTPIPLTKDVTPKNNLFKTILVGSVQLSCFMLLIVAFTFPEAKC